MAVGKEGRALLGRASCGGAGADVGHDLGGAGEDGGVGVASNSGAETDTESNLLFVVDIFGSLNDPGATGASGQGGVDSLEVFEHGVDANFAWLDEVGLDGAVVAILVGQSPAGSSIFVGAGAAILVPADTDGVALSDVVVVPLPSGEHHSAGGVVTDTRDLLDGSNDLGSVEVEQVEGVKGVFSESNLVVDVSQSRGPALGAINGVDGAGLLGESGDRFVDISAVKNSKASSSSGHNFFRGSF